MTHVTSTYMLLFCNHLLTEFTASASAAAFTAPSGELIPVELPLRGRGPPPAPSSPSAAAWHRPSSQPWLCCVCCSHCRCVAWAPRFSQTAPRHVHLCWLRGSVPGSACDASRPEPAHVLTAAWCTSPAHVQVPPPHQILLTKARFKGKIIKNVKRLAAEQKADVGCSWDQGPMPLHKPRPMKLDRSKRR